MKIEFWLDVTLLKGHLDSEFHRWLGIFSTEYYQSEENFDHWSTPQLLLESVNRGCHLCALMWAQMSSEQQDTLLGGDERVVEEMEDELQLRNILAPAEVSNIRNEYHL